MKRFGKIVAVLLLLLVVASSFVACGEVTKRVRCEACGNYFNYATIRKHVNCPYCGYPYK